MAVSDMLHFLLQKGRASRREAETIKREMRRLETDVGRLNGLLGEDGHINPQVFKRGPIMHQLPAECASMTSTINQVIAHNTWTVATAYEVTDYDTAYNHGVAIDRTAGYFNIRGFPLGSVLRFTAMVNWEANANGFRELRLWLPQLSSGWWISSIGGFAGGGVVCSGSLAVKTWRPEYQMSLGVYQNSGGDLNLTNKIFQVERIR